MEAEVFFWGGGREEKMLEKLDAGGEIFVFFWCQAL